MEEAGLLISGLAALGTLIQAYYSRKQSNKQILESTINKAEERSKVPLKIGQKRVSEVIDYDLLQVLQQDIEKQNKRLIDVLRSKESSIEQKEEEINDSRKLICYSLNLILLFNNNKLPTKRLRKFWESNNCTKKIEI